ncbi:MAG: E22 family MetX-like putative esterase [Wenzhouxiangella sp.]
MLRNSPTLLLLAFLVLIPSAVCAGDLLVEKQVFTTTSFETFGGQVIPEVRVGWESYGTLDEDRGNVILITHFFSGTSHAAGRYSEDDPEPGYWDSIIGPGKPVDTDRFFVISVDTLVNANVHDPNVITTGPASIDPRTGKPYGMGFPVVTIRDFVEVQRLLLESLGIAKLHAVIGASMGSFQALEWAVAYPERVERMVSVIGGARTRAWEIALLESWAEPIRLDPNWRGGDYYEHQPPLAGLTTSMMLLTLNALHPDFFEMQFGSRRRLDRAGLESMDEGFAVNDWLRERARGRAEISDANHVLYLVRANQLFVAGHDGDFADALARVRARTLFLPSANDLLLRPELAREAHRALAEHGNDTQLDDIEGPMGHLNGVALIQTRAEQLREFLR